MCPKALSVQWLTHRYAIVDIEASFSKMHALRSSRGIGVTPMSADQESRPLTSTRRQWNEFLWTYASRLVARKHRVGYPSFGPSSFSDEELRNQLDLLRRLSHLPPSA